MRDSRWLLALALLGACGKEAAEPTAEDRDRALLRASLDAARTEALRQSTAFRSIEELTAQELVELRGEREQGSVLSEADLAVLAEYDRTLERIMTGAEADGPAADATKPAIVTRDYELWVLPNAGRNRYTVKDRAGKVLAERVDEERLRHDFSYLHNLLHPEYLQLYDAVDY